MEVPDVSRAIQRDRLTASAVLSSRVRTLPDAMTIRGIRSPRLMWLQRNNMWLQRS
jgi:hypothetical protein